MCNGSGTDCRTSCTSNLHCQGPLWFCNGSGQCQFGVATGEDCSYDGMCLSGNCSYSNYLGKKICCDQACNENCKDCGVPGATKGICSNNPSQTDVTGGCGTCDWCNGSGSCTAKPDGTADSGCPDNTGSNICGADGKCAGNGSCRSASPAGKTCGGETCEGGVSSPLKYNKRDTCNGSGSCTDNGQTTCDDNEFCTVNKCANGSGCYFDAAPQNGKTCSAGSCTSTCQPVGTDITWQSPGSCSSGACSIPAPSTCPRHTGCWNVTCDPTNGCSQEAHATTVVNSTTGATTGAIVASDSCSDGYYQPATTCNSSGSSFKPAAYNCPNGYGCKGTKCRVSCFNGSGADNSYCRSGFSCTETGDAPLYKCQ